jgi:hypothetical protein
VLLPTGLRGKILAVDPKYDFVVLNIGEDQGAKERGVMMVDRDGKLLGKVRIKSSQRPLCRQHPARLEARRNHGRRRSSLLMKKLRTVLCALAFGCGRGMAGGLRATDEDAGLSPNPWNTPQGWEGPLPSTINQGR